jgi:hypothetical protein
MDDTQFGVLGHGARRSLPAAASTVGLELLAIAHPKGNMQTHMTIVHLMVFISGLNVESSGYRHA